VFEQVVYVVYVANLKFAAFQLDD